MRSLLGHAYYGDELLKIPEGTHRTRMGLHALLPEFRRVLPQDWETVERTIAAHFGPARPGAFGGQITAGDGWFLGAFMAAMRPSAMIEIGVASGYSSALILSLARDLGLFSDGVYLHSFDMVKTHGNGCETGALLRADFPALVPHWRLTPEVTTATLDPAEMASRLPGRTLAFMDGGHYHSWPVVDLTFLRRVPQCSWALMQDVQMMERWVSDAVLFQVPVPHPVRGAQLALAHWPGRKVCGQDICFNMAAVDLAISDAQERDFLLSMQSYPTELPEDQTRICRDYLAKL
jgi:hypothetical protein